MENQVFYKNSFSGAGVGITASSKMAIRQNNYSGFSPLYSGAMLPGGVIEAPSRVIEIPAQPNGSVVKTVLSIWNSGTETLDWSAQSHTSWLGLSSTSGSIAHEGESSVLELSANPQNLSQGVHKGYVSVTNGGQTKNYTILLNVGSSTSTNPIAPIISLTAPQTNTSYTSPATITISANASDPDGSITKVEIYWDNGGAPTVFQTDDLPFSGKVYKHLYPNFQAPLTEEGGLPTKAPSAWSGTLSSL